MSKHQRFRLKDLDLLRGELSALGLSLPIAEDVSILADRVSIGRREAPNRLAVQPMEGFDSTPDGSPGELSFRRYARYAAGGVGLIWFEATAVLHEARSNPNQLCLHRDNVDVYARLVAETRRTAREAFGRDLVMVIQLTHSGRYSKPAGMPRPIIAHHSAVLDPKHQLPRDYPLVTDEYLDRLQEVYLEAARLAARAGFDGVDLKSCHRYLLSELLASHTREGKYGGSLENRSRMLRETLEKIRGEAPEVFITTRMNVYDAIPYPYGFGVSRESHEIPDLSEPLKLIGQLRAMGMPMINVSVGNPYYNPHYGRPYDRPVVGAAVPDEHPLAGVARFVEITRQVQQAHPDLPVVGGGYSWLRHLMPYVAAGVVRSGWATLIGQGRGSFAYPDWARDVLTQGCMDPAKTCITCSGCTQIMRDGTMTGCVVRDSQIYGEQYKLGRRFALDRLQEQARKCQDCQFPTCTAGCPAGIDVPSFLRAFAANDIPAAYEVLRRSNVLPEMCACVCPSEVQCEGGCVERIFTEHALPIRDIQRVVSRLARHAGITGVRLPAAGSGRRAAVVGGGPAGIACAVRLLEKGHSVVIYEKSSRLGGTPDASIPGCRYADAAEEIDAILAPALEEKEGQEKRAGNLSTGAPEGPFQEQASAPIFPRLEIRFGQALGTHVSFAELRGQFDAVFLALGLGPAASLGQAEGVIDALAFLQDVKRGRIVTAPERVAVLGAGNTAIDAALTAQRLGARHVYLVYRRSWAEMPAWPSDREQLLASGVHPLILTAPLGYETNGKGRLSGLRVARIELGEPDSSGRRAPKILPGTESVLRVEMVIEALGLAISPELRETLSELSFTRHGLVATQPDAQATSSPGVYAGGDLVNGGTTVVQAIAEGMHAAEEIDRWLRSRAS